MPPWSLFFPLSSNFIPADKGPDHPWREGLGGVGGETQIIFPLYPPAHFPFNTKEPSRVSPKIRIQRASPPRFFLILGSAWPLLVWAPKHIFFSRLKLPGTPHCHRTMLNCVACMVPSISPQFSVFYPPLLCLMKDLRYGLWLKNAPFEW